jgi:hypothetical protein
MYFNLSNTLEGRLEVRLTVLFCEKLTVAKSKEQKAGKSVNKRGRIFTGRAWLKKCSFANKDDHQYTYTLWVWR